MVQSTDKESRGEIQRSSRTKRIIARFTSLGRYLLENRSSRIGIIIITIFILMGVFAPVLAPYDPAGTETSNRFEPPSSEHWFGTDRLGRDIFSRILFGARVALLEGFVSAGLAAIIGVGIGSLSGYYHDTWIDSLLMRSMDVIFAFPFLLIALALIGSLGFESFSLGPVVITRLAIIIFILTLLTIPRIARVSRSTVLSEVQKEYVQAKKLMGENTLRIMFVDIQKNAIGPVFIQTVIRAGYNLIAGAGLSFLGFGIRPPKSDWGLMLAVGQRVIISGHWWVIFFPGLAILLTVLSVNLIGDAFRDYLDPNYRL